MTDPRQVLDRLRTGAFDAVTLDVRTPHLDGLEALREIGSGPKLRSTRWTYAVVASGAP